MKWISKGTAAGLIATMFAAGCVPESHFNTDADFAESETASPAVDASLDRIAPETNLLATQSQRDVEAILNARNRSSMSSQESSAEPSPSPAPRKTIVWNDPKSRSNAATANAITVAVDSASDTDEAGLKHAEAGSEAGDAEASEHAAAGLGPDRLKSLMVDLSRELYATGAYSEAPLRELLMIAAMSLVDPSRQLDPQAIPDLTVKERELLATLQAFFARLGSALDDTADAEQSIVQAVANLREQLIEQPTLRLPTAALCTRVGGFGDYTPFERNSFLAQAQQKVIVYLEIDDFTSELNKQGEYVTRIAQQLVIYNDRDGLPVWKEDWQTAVDVTKNARQDFFTVQVITLPRALSVGRYQLKIRVRDELSEAEAETTIPLELVADPRLASK